MQRQEIPNLIKKYNAGTASADEKELVESWYMQFEQKNLQDLTHAEREADLDMIWTKLPVHRQKVWSMAVWYRVAAAAVVLLFLSIGIYYMAATGPDQQKVIQAIAKITTPGGNKAILTLSNGSQVVLTGARNGQVAMQSNIVINKTADGKLIYQPGTQAATNALAYNTMTTPAGGTYDLTLADGTRVKLDAASSIRYPVAFNGDERRVEVTGQVYFEVAHNKAKPFRVTGNGQTVEVLGTHFNVNAYTDERATQTTLLEGSVKVTKAGSLVLLKPGQQSVIAMNSDAISVKEANVETALAWKNGLFTFERADLQTVMRQFARWYNVQVIYEGDAPRVAITGKVLRKANATQVLEILVKLGIKFKVDGQKIIVLQK
jgi:transmembrane sensor